MINEENFDDDLDVIDDKYKEVADYYGYDTRCDQTIEEMAELAQAIIKERRYPEEREKRRADIKEEIADVFVCLTQLIYLTRTSFDEISEIADGKIQRELVRISEKKEACTTRKVLHITEEVDFVEEIRE